MKPIAQAISPAHRTCTLNSPPLFRAMFIDTNPIPVKKAVEILGMAAGPVRLPLDELDEGKTEQLRKVLEKL